MGEIEKLIETVRQIAYDLHVYLGNGYLEKVYEVALAHRIEKAGLDVKRQIPLPVYDEDGFCIGEYFADILVEGTLVVELKAARTLAPEHYAQIISYLKTSGRKYGLLINFGAFKFEVRKIVSPDFNSSTRSTFLHGKSHNSSTRSTFLHGKSHNSSTRSTFLHG